MNYEGFRAAWYEALTEAILNRTITTGGTVRPNKPPNHALCTDIHKPFRPYNGWRA
jgi:hypothetical protein